MPDHKKHHFVSRFYLHNFGRNGKISAFHLSRKKHIHNISVKDQCQGDHLYGKTDEIEKALSGLENATAKIIREIISTENLPKLFTKERIRLNLFIAIQHGRTKAAAAEMETTATKMMRATYTGLTTRSGEKIDDLSRVRMKNEFPELLSAGTSAKFSFSLLDLDWLLVANKTEIEFITSDAPVVLYNQWAEEAMGDAIRGYASMGLQIFFPISPRHLLILYDREVYDVDQLKPGTIEVRSPASINKINRLQLLSVDKALYYSGKDSTGKKIDDFPLSWHWTADKKVVAYTKEASNNKSRLAMTHHQCQNVGLRLPFLRTKPSLGLIPVDKRARKVRPAAQIMINEILKNEKVPKWSDFSEAESNFTETKRF